MVPTTASEAGGRALNGFLRYAPVAIVLLIFSGAAAATVGAQSSAPPAIVTVISSDGVNLRPGPDTTAGIVSILSFDTTLTVTGTPTPDGWYPVSVGAQTGWVDGAYIAAGTLDATAARSAGPMDGAPSLLSATSPSPSPSAHMSTLPAPGSALTPAMASPAAGAASSTPGSTETMTASYYGVDDSTVPGTMTACGIPFDPMNTNNASTNDFSCGTKLLVTAPGGKQITVVVTDHGGYVAHWMDLTYAAFALIADHRQGVVQVTVQVEP